MLRKGLSKRRLKKKYHLTTKELSDIRRLFASVDRNRNDKISLNELKHMLNQLNKQVENEELVHFFSRLDKNSDGAVDFEDFIRFLIEEELTMDEDPFLLEAFCFFDLNGDGLITKTEFEKAMRFFGENWTMSEISDLVALAGLVEFLSFSRFDGRLFSTPLSLSLSL